MLVLKVESRKPGKVKQLLKEGFVPGIVYGKKIKNPIPVKFKKTEFIKLYKEVGSSTPIKLEGDGINEMVLIYDYQLEPVRDLLIHVDFLAVSEDEVTKAWVPVVVEGIEDLQKKGLEVNVVVDEVEVEALPSKLPREIKINVSNLKDGDTITVGDLKLPEGVKILSEESEVLVSVYNPAESQEESENTEENE